MDERPILSSRLMNLKWEEKQRFEWIQYIQTTPTKRFKWHTIYVTSNSELCIWIEFENQSLKFAVKCQQWIVNRWLALMVGHNLTSTYRWFSNTFEWIRPTEIVFLNFVIANRMKIGNESTHLSICQCVPMQTNMFELRKTSVAFMFIGMFDWWMMTTTDMNTGLS